MISAAGVLVLTKDNLALFVKRGDGSDHPAEWCVPGGQREEGESPEAAALREFEEETGCALTEADLRPHTRGVALAEPLVGQSEDVDYTTFLAQCEAPFPMRSALPNKTLLGKHRLRLDKYSNTS